MKKLKMSYILLACLAALSVPQAAYAQSSGDITVPGRSLTDKLAWLKANAKRGFGYIIEINGNERIAPNQRLEYSGNEGVTIFIVLRGVGSNRNISLTGKGSMFIVGAGVWLTLDNNITLQGRNDNGSNYLVNVTGGSLYMMEGSAITGNSGGGVYVESGLFVMRGGTISGNKAAPSGEAYVRSLGGGVYVGSLGRFEMFAGTISGNTADHGGGVYVDSDPMTKPSRYGVQERIAVAMRGGTISGNSGGGVSVGRGNISMKGGTISGNSSGNGGVSVGEGTFTMEDGFIIDNRGGGVVVFNEEGTFTMSGGAISGNSGGGGVSVTVGTFNMSGGTISRNTSSYYEGGGVSVGGFNDYELFRGTFNMSGGTISSNTASGDYGRGGGGVYVIGGTFTMSDGSISRNTTSGNGGGVCVSGGGATFTKTGGTIYGSDAEANSNTAANSEGQAVCVLINESINYHRESTAGPNVRLDSTKAGAAGGWE